MNLTTPIDGNAPRAAALDEDARLVDGPGAILLVDVGDCTILDANAAAASILGIAGRGPHRLDRAMPAWTALEAHVTSGVVGRSRPVSLLWWTPTGPQTLTAALETVARPPRRLIRIVLAADAQSEQSRSTIAEPPTQAEQDARASDLATLREIARRIRAGTAAAQNSQPDAASEQSAAPATTTRPPPLDFKPPAAAATGTAENQLPAEAVAKLAHELRTPLGAIVLLAEIMRDERLGAMGNARYKTYAADIHDSARHTLDLVSAMLDGYRGAANDVTPKATAMVFETIDLNDLADRCASAMRPVAARGGVALDAALDPALPPLTGDRRALRQIILNVMSNAMRFTPRDGRITLSTAVRADGATTLTVSDTGSGMGSADIARARGQTPAGAAPRRIRLAGDHSGFGFGLPLVRELTEAHGGSVEIDSKPGEGTRVVVSFPAEQVKPL